MDPRRRLGRPALDAVTRALPKIAPVERLRIVKHALEHAASLGVTSVQDMNPAYEDIAVYADLVVLSDDIFTIPPVRIKDVHVLTTIVGGRIVHQRRP